MLSFNFSLIELFLFFRGRLTFWDGNKGLQLDTHQSHKADILSICLNREETKLYCAGNVVE